MSKVIVEKGPHYRATEATVRPHHHHEVQPQDAYEAALQVAKYRNPGTAAVMSQGELSKIREIANKPPTPRLQAKSHKPKDSDNFLI